VIRDTGGRLSRAVAVTAVAIAIATVVLLGGSSMAAAQVVPTTSVSGPTTSVSGPTTSVTVTNSVFPGVEQSTAVDDPAQRRLQWIIVGLLVLAGVSLVFSVFFWQRTRGSREAVEVTDESVPATQGAPVPSLIPERLREVPIWADDPPASDG
jgi:hypothetical protein